jgi:ferredoxin-thioredoxin reductase catalytic subunit
VAKKSAVKAKVTREQVIRTIKFAQDNKVFINPVGMTYYLEGFSMFHTCPCDTTRKFCPCDQALDEIKKDGHCTCRLFWKDYQAYLDLYYPEEKN